MTVTVEFVSYPSKSLGTRSLTKLDGRDKLRAFFTIKRMTKIKYETTLAEKFSACHSSNSQFFCLFAPQESLMDVPVILVGNKNDQWGDRMVSNEEGYRRSKEISCVCFHEISARESADQVMAVFRDATRYWRVLSKSPKLKRSTSETASELVISPDTLTPCLLPSDGTTTPTATTPTVKSEKRMSMLFFGRLWAESSPDENEELQSQESDAKQNGPFRERASTDGTLLSRPRRWRFPPPTTSGSGSLTPHPRSERRMSISLRGSNTNSSY